MSKPSTRAAMERVFQVLETLALNPEGLALKNLAGTTGIESSTLSRICATLVTLGLVRKNNYRVFAVDAGLVYLGIRAMDAFRLPAGVEKILGEAAAEESMEIALGTRHRHDALYLYRGGRSLQKDVEPVAAFHPLHGSNIGLTVLAMENLPVRECSSLLMESYGRDTGKSLPTKDLKRLLTLLEETRTNGYGIMDLGGRFNSAFPFRWRDRWYSVALYGRLGASRDARRKAIALTCLLRDKIRRAVDA